ncbi:MAG: MBL fold metallo-hydrolase [Patescibacteria group bacterium]|nr:MBL fold metallo-hydrolase [Patescibacteria group bacterium]
MYITWLGHSAFRLQDKIGTDGVSVVTDPFEPAATGLKWSSLESDIVVISANNNQHNFVKGIKGEPVVIDCPGEYEYKGVYIEGIDAKPVVIYRIQIDDLVIAHLGSINRILDAKEVEQLEGTDILFIPVGGKDCLNAKTAVEVVNQIEPRIVIPMAYQIDGLKFDLDSVEKFVKEIGLNTRREDKLKISKKDLPTEDTELIILNY